MVKWVVGQPSSDGTVAARMPADNGFHSLEKLPQPITIQTKRNRQEVELEVGADNKRLTRFLESRGKQKGAPQPERRVIESEVWEVIDKDNRVRFSGSSVAAQQDSSFSWFVVKETQAKTETVYELTPVDEWIGFTAKTMAMESALDLEETERVMKESRIKAKSEFNEYLKQKRKKAEEIGIAVPKPADEEDTNASQKARRKLLFKRVRGNDDGDDMDIPDSSVAYVGKSREIEGQWEGEEAFSDDDEQLFDDEANANVGLDIDVEDDDVENDKEARDDEDLDAQAEELFKNTFGSEVEKLIHNEQEKEHVADEDLDDELSKYAADLTPEAEEEEKEEGAKPPAGEAAAPVTKRPTSKEEQIRARVKGMFWRNDNKLKLKEVLTQFPGLNKASEEYQFLTKALRDLADVQKDMLVLKQQFRK